MCRPSSLIIFLFLLPLVAFPEPHSKREKTPSIQFKRQVAIPNNEEKAPLFKDEPGDLSDSERNEVEQLSSEIRKAAKTAPERGNNLGEYLRWDGRAHAVLQLQKRLSEKLETDNLQTDAQIAKTELDELLKICEERKNKGLTKWLRPW